MHQITYVTSSSGLPVPGIIYGTAWKQDATASLVEQALKLGFRGIDTACQPKHYYEPGVGAGIQAWIKRGYQREALYLQSKFTSLDGQDPLRIPYADQASLAEQVVQSLQTSLQNLQTDYLDCLVLHSPLPNLQDTLSVWRAMEGLVANGVVKQLGLSNCYRLELLTELYRIAVVKPSVLQNRFYAQTVYDQELRLFCRQQQIIYQSFWTLTANPHLLTHPVVLNLANQYQRTPAQLFFRYLTQRGIIPLTGTTSKQHMQEDLAIFAFELQDAECALVDNLLVD